MTPEKMIQLKFGFIISLLVVGQSCAAFFPDKQGKNGTNLVASLFSEQTNSSDSSGKSKSQDFKTEDGDGEGGGIVVEQTFQVDPIQAEREASSLLIRQMNEFSCQSRDEGFYASLATTCRGYHKCSRSPDGTLKTTFICPRGQRFDIYTNTCRPSNSTRCVSEANRRTPRQFQFFMRPQGQSPPQSPIYFFPRAVPIDCFTCCHPAKNSDRYQTTEKPPYTWIVTTNRPERPTTTTASTWIVTFSTTNHWQTRPTTTRRPWTTKPWYPAPTRTTRRTTTRRPPVTWRPTKPWQKPTNDYTWVVTTKKPTKRPLSDGLDINEIEIISEIKK